MRSLRPLAASGLSNLPDNPTSLPDEKDRPSSGLSRASSGSRHRTRRQETPYLCWILRLSSGLSGYLRRYERGCLGESGRRGQGDGALEVLKAWCELRTGKTPGPSDVAEERRRPCRAQRGHDFYG